MAREIQASQQQLNDHQLRMRTLVTRCKVVANATPASKTHVVDVPGVVFLKTEGKDDVAAQDSGAVTAAKVDTNGQIGLLVKLDDDVEEVTMIQLEKISAGTGTLVATRVGDGISASGNIEILLDDSADSLATTDIEFTLRIEYKV